MNCVHCDIKGYFLNELSAAERRTVEQHASACPACAEELDRLRLTQAAMLGLRDEEIPRRLAFVAGSPAPDPWWKRMWQGLPVSGLASAAMLSAAIVTHALYQPVAPPPAAPTVDVAAIEARVDERVREQVRAAVTQAVSDARIRDEQRTVALVASAEKRLQAEHREQVVALQASIEYWTKRANVQRVAMNRDAFEVRQ